MQYSLVGDLVMAVREGNADPPQNLAAPTGVALSCSPTGSQNFWIKVTQLTPWGESAPSAEATIANGSVTGTITVTGNCSFAATAIRVYFSLSAAGGEDRYYPYTIPTGGIGSFSIPFTLSSTGIATGFPPQRSSAWLPDTDGIALSAAAMYRWINEGLDAATALAEGVRDITGIPSTNGQAQYQPVGNWRKISDGQYDGWPFTFGHKSDIFRRSNVVGIVGTAVMNQDSYIQQIEVWPQPSRTSGIGTLSSGITSTATTLSYTAGSSAFVLGFGLALLGTFPGDPSQCELVYYSGTGNGTQLTQLTRGMGGTSPQAWPSGTNVQECNIYLSGIRYPQHYSIGSASNILSLPPAWIDALTDYLNSRFKKAEQDIQSAEALYKSFETKCQSIKGNRQVLGPRQVQIGGTTGVETVCGAGGFFGGVILP